MSINFQCILIIAKLNTGQIYHAARYMIELIHKDYTSTVNAGHFEWITMFTGAMGKTLPIVYFNSNSS